MKFFNAVIITIVALVSHAAAVQPTCCEYCKRRNGRVLDIL